MEKGKQKIFFFLGIFIFLIFASFFVEASAGSVNFSIYGEFCGDGIRQVGEQCDLTELGTGTCENVLGISGAIGTLSCSSDCTFDFSNCSVPSCGDGTCSATEDCSNCVADCACSSGYTCTSGVCVADAAAVVVDDGGGGGGGGGGTIVTTSYDFSLAPSSINVLMQKGEYYQKQIVVTNIGTQDLLINISLTNLGEFIILEKKFFILKKDKNETIKFNVYAPSEKDNDVYLGKINFNSPYVRKSVNVVLNIREPVPLFDIKTTILKKFLLPGDIIEADVRIINLGELKNISVDLEYAVKNFDDKIFVSDERSFILDEFFSERLSLELPNSISMGEYIFYSRVNYGERGASSYDSFFIEKLSLLILVILIIFIFIIIVILIIFIIKKRKKEKEST